MFGLMGFLALPFCIGGSGLFSSVGLSGTAASSSCPEFISSNSSFVSQVSSFCTEAAIICNSLLHPRMPSLQLPLAGPSTHPPSSSEVSSAVAAAAVTSPFCPALPPPFPAARIPAPGPLPANSLGLPLSGLAAAQLPPRLIPEEPAPPLSPGTAEAAALATGAKLRRSVFIHYDKEEEEDVEISLESDSDDSVVIVPKGQLGKMPSTLGSGTASVATPAPMPLPAPPAATTPLPMSPSVACEEDPLEAPAPLPLGAPPPSLAAAALPPSPVAVAGEAPVPALLEEDPTVININSSEEEDEDEEEEEEEDFPEDEEYLDEEEEVRLMLRLGPRPQSPPLPGCLLLEAGHPWGSVVWAEPTTLIPTAWRGRQPFFGRRFAVTSGEQRTGPLGS